MLYDGTKPNISQDMLAFEASIRENQEGIRTGAGFKFSTLNVENTSTGALLSVKTTTSGATNAANVSVSRGDQASGYAQTSFWTAATSEWSLGLRPGDRRFCFRDDVQGLIKLQLLGGPTTSWLGTPDAQTFVLGTNNLDRVYIDANGRVGIGAAPVTHALEVNGGINTTGSGGFWQGGWKWADYSANTTRVGGINAAQWDSVELWTGGASRLRVTNGGATFAAGAAFGGPITASSSIPSAYHTSVVENSAANGFAQLVLRTGNGTASGGYAIYSTVLNQSAQQAWVWGNFGNANWTLRDATAGRNVIIADTTGQTTFGGNANFAGRVLINSPVDAGFALDVKTDPSGSVRFYDGGSSRRGIEFAYLGNETMRILGYDRQASIYQSLNFECANVGFSFAGAAATFGNGVGVISVPNRFATPTASPANGAIWWVENGASKARGSSGTVTTFAPADPHCPCCGGDFVLEQYNDITGRYLSVCWDCWAEEKGERGWIVRRSREAIRVNKPADVAARKQVREQEADALISLESVIQPVLPPAELPPVAGDDPTRTPLIPPADSRTSPAVALGA